MAAMAEEKLRAAASSFAQAIPQRLQKQASRLRRILLLPPPLQGMSSSSSSSSVSTHTEASIDPRPPILDMENVRDFIRSKLAPPPSSGHSQRQERHGLLHQGQHAPHLDGEQQHHAPDRDRDRGQHAPHPYGSRGASSDSPPPKPPILDIEDVRAFIRSKLAPHPSQHGPYQVHQEQHVPHVYAEQQHHGIHQGQHVPHLYAEQQHHGIHQGQHVPHLYAEQQHHGLHHGQHVPHLYAEQQHHGLHQGQHVPHLYAAQQHHGLHQGQHVPHLYAEQQHHGLHHGQHASQPYSEQQHHGLHQGQHASHPYDEQQHHGRLHQGQHASHPYGEQQHHGLHQGLHVPHIRSVPHAPQTENPEHYGHGHLGLHPHGHYDQAANRLQQHDLWHGHDDESPRAQSHVGHVSSGLFGIGTMGTSPSSEGGGYIPISSSHIHEQQQQQQHLSAPSLSVSSPLSPAFTSITGTNGNAHRSHGLLDIEDVRDFVESFLHRSFIRRRPSTSWRNKMPWHVPRPPFLARGLDWPPETFASETERKEFYRRSRKRKPFLMGSPPLWTITAFNLLFLQALMFDPVRKFSDFLRSLP